MCIDIPPWVWYECRCEARTLFYWLRPFWLIPRRLHRAGLCLWHAFSRPVIPPREQDSRAASLAGLVRALVVVPQTTAPNLSGIDYPV